MVHIKISVVFILAATAITSVVPLPMKGNPNLQNPHHDSSPASQPPPEGYSDRDLQAAHLLLMFHKEELLHSHGLPASAPTGIVTSQPQESSEA